MKSQKALEIQPFEESSSLVFRLKAIVVSVILLIVISFLSIYYTSLPFFDGLKKMNSINKTLTSILGAIDSLETSEKEIKGLNLKTNLKDSKSVYNESQKLFNSYLTTAENESQHLSDLTNNIKLIRSHNLNYEKSAKKIYLNLFQQKTISPKDEVEILVAVEYATDMDEILRQTIIILRKKNDNLFAQIYETRFRPVFYGLISSIFFFSFVAFFGYTMTRRLNQSLDNLSRATWEVTQGNMDYEAPILDKDEIGYLTHSFNRMVKDLKFKKEELETTAIRIEALQEVTEAFSEALTHDQVYNIVIEKGLKAAKADAAAVVMVSADEKTLEFKRMDGYGFQRENLPLENQEYPLIHTIRYGKTFYFENFDQLLERFPAVSVFPRPKAVEANIYLPLLVTGRVVGAVVFSFNRPRIFSNEEKQFILALARQSAQALHRSQLFEEARLAIEARDEFLSIASHELRTPLTPLKLMLQGLSRNIKKDPSVITTEKISKIIDTSDQQITKLARLIEDLLDVSRISAGKLTLQKENFNLSQMIDEIVKYYAQQSKDVKTEINTKTDPTIVGFLDRLRIEQVLINLLTNAFKYAPGKPIDVELTAHLGVAKILVKDQGPGITAQDQEKIFDRFERIRAKDNFGGLGLGLYISKQIVEAHGGKISVESVMGVGSTFIVEIPLLYHEPKPISEDLQHFS